MASFKLVVSIAGSEQKALAEHLCEKEQIAIGRAAANDVVLPDVEKRISGRHARIDRAGGAYQLVDLGSTNGTFLNDRKLEPNVGMGINDGDRIAIGNYLLKFLLMEGATEQTVVLVDPSRLSSQLAEELPALYARHAGRAPEERRKVLKEAIRSAIKSAGA
jgi:predicted component of type VI protein secretion system